MEIIRTGFYIHSIQQTVLPRIHFEYVIYEILANQIKSTKL